MTLQNKRLSRHKLTSEVFTPIPLVDEMLSKLPSEVWAPDKSFLDNSAGNGNFLVCILARKLSYNHPPLQALSTIYGVELMADNVEEMKQRLLEALPELDDTQKQQAIDIINHNIVCHDALTWDYENWCSKNHKAKPLF